MEIKVAGFGKIAIIGKQTAVDLHSGAIPGLKDCKKKPNITEIVSLSVAIFC